MYLPGLDGASLLGVAIESDVKALAGLVLVARLGLDSYTVMRSCRRMSRLGCEYHVRVRTDGDQLLEVAACVVEAALTPWQRVQLDLQPEQPSYFVRSATQLDTLSTQHSIPLDCAPLANSCSLACRASDPNTRSFMAQFIGA